MEVAAKGSSGRSRYVCSPLLPPPRQMNPRYARTGLWLHKRDRPECRPPSPGHVKTQKKGGTGRNFPSRSERMLDVGWRMSSGCFVISIFLFYGLHFWFVYWSRVGTAANWRNEMGGWSNFKRGKGGRGTEWGETSGKTPSDKSFSRFPWTFILSTGRVKGRREMMMGLLGSGLFGWSSERLAFLLLFTLRCLVAPSWSKKSRGEGTLFLVASCGMYFFLLLLLLLLASRIEEREKEGKVI